MELVELIRDAMQPVNALLCVNITQWGKDGIGIFELSERVHVMRCPIPLKVR